MKILSSQIFWFCNANVTTFPTSRKWKISIFPLHCPSRNAISSKVFNEFSKNFFWQKDEEDGYGAWKFQVRRYFSFAIANVTTFPTPGKCKNFNFSLYAVPAEILYLQKYLTNFQKRFFLAETQGRWLFWLKISRSQIFWFSNGNGTTFPTSGKCKNFNFFLYPLPAEMLYLQKYIGIFKKRFFWLKDEEGWLLRLKMSSAQSFCFCNSHMATFPTSRKWKNFNFSFTLS